MIRKPDEVRMKRIGTTLLLLLATWMAGAAQAQPVRGDHIESELVAATDAVVPGQPLQVGLRLAHDRHWHTYWQVPGDSGLPTQIKWKLPPGWSAGPIEWPVPQRLPVGPLMNFGYEGEVFLLTTLKPPVDLPPDGSTQISARADWLICEAVCIPDGADLTLTLPVRTEAQPSRRAAQVAGARALVPRPIALDAATATIEGNRIRLAFKPQANVASLEFFPLEEARIEAPAAQTLKSEDRNTALYLTAAQPVAQEFKTLKGLLVANGGPRKADQGGWAGTIELPLRASALGAGFATLADSGGGDGNAPLTLWIALAGALIGGLILNLMPCVFPVLSLKLLALVRHQHDAVTAHAAPVSMPRHGFAFTAGVVASFLLLAALLLALRAGGTQLGWGFQLQTPWVVATLTALFFVIGLNLLGAFEFAFGGAIASSAAAERLQSARVSGSFWTGVLAVVVAAPCTAPFMGAALGYAVTQPAAEALLVFAVLGIGMAAPWLLLTFAPQLLSRLPRPGAWMERFKQAMAFPMFATCVWLLWVLAQQVEINAVAIMLGVLVLLGLAAWAIGLAQRGAPRYRWVALIAAGSAAYALIAATAPAAIDAKPVRAAADTAWQPWTLTLQQQTIASGKPVFVDFTAAWCVTCQANKQLVLRSRGVQQEFAARGVVLMRADWTRRDDAITQELARFKRNGVPLYVMYDSAGRARVLPELLTERLVLDALDRVAPAKVLSGG